MIRLEMYVFGLQLCESTVFWVIMDGDAPVTQNRASHIYIIDFGGTFAPNFSQQIDCTFYLHCIEQLQKFQPKKPGFTQKRYCRFTKTCSTAFLCNCFRLGWVSGHNNIVQHSEMIFSQSPIDHDNDITLHMHCRLKYCLEHFQASFKDLLADPNISPKCTSSAVYFKKI